MPAWAELGWAGLVGRPLHSKQGGLLYVWGAVGLLHIPGASVVAYTECGPVSSTPSAAQCHPHTCPWFPLSPPCSRVVHVRVGPAGGGGHYRVPLRTDCAQPRCGEDLGSLSVHVCMSIGILPGLCCFYSCSQPASPPAFYRSRTASNPCSAHECLLVRCFSVCFAAPSHLHACQSTPLTADHSSEAVVAVNTSSGLHFLSALVIVLFGFQASLGGVCCCFIQSCG